MPILSAMLTPVEYVHAFVLSRVTVGWPGVALGVTAAEHESLGRQLAAEFRAGMVTAAEATVTRALVGLGLE